MATDTGSSEEALYEIWNLNDCAADRQSSGGNRTVASGWAETHLAKRLHQYLVTAVKGAFCHLFLWVSDPLSALDWLILTLVSSTWTWSECKSQVCACVCCLHFRACITCVYCVVWTLFMCVCVCARACVCDWGFGCDSSDLYQRDLRGLTISTPLSIIPPFVCLSSLSLYFIQSFSPLSQFNNWIQVNKWRHGTEKVTPIVEVGWKSGALIGRMWRW